MKGKLRIDDYVTHTRKLDDLYEGFHDMHVSDIYVIHLSLSLKRMVDRQLHSLCRGNGVKEHGIMISLKQDVHGKSCILRTNTPSVISIYIRESGLSVQPEFSIVETRLYTYTVVNHDPRCFCAQQRSPQHLECTSHFSSPPSTSPPEIPRNQY